jgi:hypothetical protein
MSCKFESDKHFCKMGFPQTMICHADNKGQYAKHFEGQPHCCKEEWCGWAYNDFGGKPPQKENK